MAIEYRDQRKSPPTVSEDGMRISGRAVPFDQETQIGASSWGFKEKINRNAFNKFFKEGDTVLLDQHDSRLPIARSSAGTLTLTRKSDGLDWTAEPTSKASYIADVMENVRAGNYGGCSIGFECVKDEWTDDDGKPSDRQTGTHREVLEAKLPETSLVTFPAYKATHVQQNGDALLSERRAAYEAAQGIAEERAEAAEERDPQDGDGPDKKKPYGNVPYADPKNEKYPIDKKHVKAAWAYINQAKNAAKYPLNGVSLSSVKAKIKAAMKKFGFTSGSAGEKKSEMDVLDFRLCAFADPEWRDDDPYLDDWYEVDEELSDEPEPGAEEENSEPVTTTRENDEYETALRRYKFNLSRMSDLEE